MFKAKVYRFVSVALLICFVVSITACGKSSGTNPSADQPKPAATQSENFNPMAKYEPSIDVSAILVYPDNYKFPKGDSADDNAYVRGYKDELGINLKYTWTAPEAQREQKMNIAIAAGDLPDIFPVNNVQMVRLANAGKIQPLDDVFNKYATSFAKEVLSDEGQKSLNSARVNGKLMGSPRMVSAIDTAHMLWIRKDWLQNLNLPEPKTMDDVLKICEAFTKNDPDGNGKADTFGISMDKAPQTSLLGFFNGFYAYPGAWIKDSTEKLVYGTIQPQTKDVLRKLNEMYKAGYIDQEFGIKDSAKITEQITAGKVGMYYGWQSKGLLFTDCNKLNPKADWRPYPIVSIDNKPGKPQASSNLKTYYVAKTGFKNPQVIFQMLNFFFTYKVLGTLENYYIYGSDKDGVGVWNLSTVYSERSKKNYEAYLHSKEAFKTGDISKLNLDDIAVYERLKSYKAGDQSLYGYNLVFGEYGAHSVSDTYIKNNLYVFNELIGSPSQELIDKGASLQKMEDEMYVQIIMGAAPIDQFDKFVENWKKLGGDTITKQVNEWYVNLTK